MSLYTLNRSRILLKSVQKNQPKYLNAFFSCSSSSSGTQSNCSKDTSEELIRNAHASEVFRTAFLNGQRSNNRISTSDLDDLVVSQRVRPSALLAFLHLGGATLGTVSRFAPKSVSE